MTTLFEFQCPGCKKFLVWTIAPGRVLCNRCGNWVLFGDLKNPSYCTVEDDEGVEQLTMFE